MPALSPYSRMMQDIAWRLQRYTLSPGRAKVVAEEVEAPNRAVLKTRRPIARVPILSPTALSQFDDLIMKCEAATIHGKFCGSGQGISPIICARVSKAVW